MTRDRLRRFAAGLALFTVVAHVLFSAAVGMVLHAAYPHRMFDIRRLPQTFSPAEIAAFVSMFLGGRAAAAERTVFYGSSFVYGFPWQETVIMSHRFQSLRPGEAVLNASVLGANMALLENGILCGARNAGVRSRVAIVELPVINSTARLASERASGRRSPQRCDMTIGRRGYTGYTLRHPLGLGWATLIWDDKAFPKSDENLMLNKVPAGYFTTAAAFKDIESSYRGQVVGVAQAARAVADRVFVFPSPVFLPGASEVGEDADAIRAQLDAAVDACRSVVGVVCLDPDSFYTRREAFYNLTHLNQRGHQEMAEWLAGQIPR